MTAARARDVQVERLWQIARQLGEHLPDDRGEWELGRTPAGWAQFRRDEFGFCLRIGQGDRTARLVVSASFGGGIGDHFNGYGPERWPMITLAWDRTPEQVAAEIRRRLLPPAERMFARLLERHREKNHSEFTKAEACRALQAASGNRLWIEARPVPHQPGVNQHRLGTRGGGSYQQGTAPYEAHGEVDHDADEGRLTVSLKLTCGEEDACAVLRLLAQRHDAAAWPAGEDDEDDTAGDFDDD